MKMIIAIMLVLIGYLVGNIYWHKKIIEGKWLYTIYSTIILIIYFLSALTSLSLIE